MQTRDYKDLFRLISSMIGTGGELSASEQTQVSNFINRRFQQAFDESPVWPRYFVNSEERDVISIELSGLSGTDGVKVNGLYAAIGTVDSGFDGNVLVPGTTVWYSKNSTTTPSFSNTTIDDAVVIYQQGIQGSQDSHPKWIVRENVSLGITKQDDGTTIVESLSSTNGSADIALKETTSGANASVSSPLDVTNWIRMSGVSGIPNLESKQLVPYFQSYSVSTGSVITGAGEFSRIFRSKAFVNKSALEYEFFVDFDGANILNIADANVNSVFVSYKQAFEPFDVTSDYYTSTVAVPGEFFNFIAHAVYADFLRVQNRQREAVAEEQVAQTYLDLELEKIDIRSNNNTVNKRFSTYVNQQSR